MEKRARLEARLAESFNSIVNCEKGLFAKVCQKTGIVTYLIRPLFGETWGNKN